VIGGFVFHHIFLGILLVIISGLVYFSIDDLNSILTKRFLIFVFGAGTGLIIDEMSFLFSVSNFYDLFQYYSSFNSLIEASALIIIFILFIISIMIRFKFEQNIQKRYDYRRK